MKTRYIIISRICLLLFFLSLFLENASAQYTPSSLSLANTFSSAVHWVDIDGDGDLDVSVSGDDVGLSSGQGILYFLQNKAVIDNMLITPMEFGDMTWCDFNNDGVPDILYAGESVGNVAGIDVVNAATKTYSNFITGFTPVRYAAVDWGDYDNDGDYDALIAGEDASNIRLTKLYRNNGTSFEDAGANLPGIRYGRVRFIDYDLDKDLDIFISGMDNNQNKYTRLWKNTNGSFAVTSDVFLNVYYSSPDWGDFNGDGYPDLVLTGHDGSAGTGLLYINNAGNGFTLSDTKVPPARYSGTGFGDVDNDGDLDLFISGLKDSVEIAGKVVFINDGAGSFAETGYTISTHTLSNFEFGDYDGDNDLDFIVNGRVGPFDGYTHVAENTCSVINAKPSVPQNPSAVLNGKTVNLSWDRSSDDHTPDKSITYNIYIGTGSKGVDIVSPHASTTTGLRKISKQGYIRDTAWTIRDLPTGTYHWGVQAIDNSLAASAFSDEGSFEIKDRFSVEIYNEPEKHTIPAIYFDCDHDNDYDLFLTNSEKTIISPYTLSGFSRSTYDTILQNSFYPTKTLSPNDWNNNNEIDFSISGNYTVDGKLDSSLALFKYVSDFNYIITDSSLIKDTDFEYAIWTDLDNDGHQDLICSGMTTNLEVNNIPVTHIYRNKGDGKLEEMAHSIRGFQKCGAVAADFNNDMMTDIFIYGKEASGLANTYLYINDGNFDFTEHLIPNNQLYRKELYYGIYPGDFDLDGQLDIYMAGVSLQNDYYARVLLNNDLAFSEANLPVKSWPSMSNYWTDYDYDGDLDIFLTSTIISPGTLLLYLNNNQILEEYNISFGIQLLKLPFMAANLDSRNGVDFMMRNSVEGNFYQYFDNWGYNNRISSAPENLSHERSDLDVIFKWDKLPGYSSCSYNLRIGTHPDSVNIMSPMSDLSTGFRYVVQPGNTFLNNQWLIKNMPPGTYYWSVQAVDQANTGGPWAPLQTITLTNINAEFTYDTVCLGNPTHFEDLSAATDAVVAWKWLFGDGQTATVKDPAHTYNSAGTYNAILWAYSLSGDSASKSHNVIVKQKPSADFSVSTACLGNTNTIINNTNENGLTISGWQWDYGDGSLPYAGKEPGSHGYTNPGSYNIFLTVTSDNDCADTITKAALVAQYPVTTVSADDALTFCMGDSVTFSVPYNSQYTYQWKLNGTNISNADSSRHTGKITGSYTVEATNPVGSCSRTSDQQIVTAQSLPPSYTIGSSGPITFCSGDSVILSVTENSAYTYQWKQNGGTVGTNSSHFVAKSSGIYTLTVSNSTGCSISSANSITVKVNPLPVVGAVSLEGKKKFCSGESAILSVPATAGYLYAWINSDGTITGASTNSYFVNTSGEYKLEVSNSSGCKVTTDPVNIEVVEKPSKPAIDTTYYDKNMCLGDKPLNISVDDLVAGYDYKWYRNGTPFSTSTSLEIIEEGIYYLEAVYNICTSQRDSAVIDFREALPKPRIDARGPAVWLLSTTSKASQYKWFLNGISIPGADGSSYMAGQNYGLYRLAVADDKGCFSFSDTIRIPLGITGIQDADPFENVKIYPNPTTGSFTIEMNNDIFGELIIDIFTQNGSKILNIKFEKTTEYFSSQIDLSGQSKGMYLLNLSLDKFRAVRKVVVE